MSIISWFATAEQSVADFVKKELGKIEGDAVVVTQAIDNAATIADNLVNGLKTWVASPAGQTIEGIINNIPGIGPYVTDVLNFLPTLVIDLNWAKAEFTKSPQQIVEDGISQAIKGAANDNIKSTNLATLQAHINTYISTMANAPVSIQASLTQANAVHVANGAPVAETPVRSQPRQSYHSGAKVLEMV